MVELPERPAGVGDHVRGEPVDRLDLGQEVGVVELAASAIGLVTSLLNDESWKARRTSGFGNAAHQPVGLRDEAGPLAGEAQERPDRRDQRHLRDVDRGADAGQRARSAGRDGRRR